MKYSILIICLPAAFLFACTPSRSVQKAYAFSQHINFGTIATDENGNQITSGSQTNRIIYLESKDNTKPVINEVVYKAKIYKNAEVTLAGQSPVQIGIKSSDGKNIILTPAPGNYLWKMEFILTENENKQQVNTDENKIIIKGKTGGKAFTLTINNEIELQPVIGV